MGKVIKSNYEKHNDYVNTGDLTEKELNEVTVISNLTIDRIIRFADKNNIDRDSAIKFFAELFECLSNLATFKNWKGGK